MTRKEHLLTILAEECAEVAQRASKALRFGLDEIQSGHTQTNAERIVAEFDDLTAVALMLNQEGFIPNSIPRRIANKVEKVESFLEYSRKVGTLTD